VQAFTIIVFALNSAKVRTGTHSKIVFTETSYISKHNFEFIYCITLIFVTSSNVLLIWILFNIACCVICRHVASQRGLRQRNRISGRTLPFITFLFLLSHSFRSPLPLCAKISVDAKSGFGERLGSGAETRGVPSAKAFRYILS